MIEPGGVDDPLADGFAAREPWAFEEAYRRFGPLLYSTAYNVLGNAEDAADCVHDALARVWRSSNAYTKARGAVRSFLTVCVRNEAISRTRSQARRTRLSERLAAEPQEYEELGAGDPIERDRLRAALSRLPPEQSEPLRLAYFQGKTHTEIAAELETPLGTIKSRIAQGLRKLGAALRDGEGPRRYE
ncbi:MAG: sigma-70 family RNA polymerase sigma factor [Candidatus Eremiobacteraeota bacterium]|nr:sigma-70 family RNA polymerase sigma factor [Candidatus Eremiobacteraeota bacterium]MBV8331360.1 sigma-70 family RNA polymerase sigma factor [Candidatus Eremiobacteraeota bacterium]MBV8435750.1 sigma-70 family RNA polymerase sigma factor [Candidatus Eremiobacteraeota bacterium]MBV8656132.1 sigma-70 family RNA polymerase sigma factor [Candidatus Eremiobacteraeota bacterium]